MFNASLIKSNVNAIADKIEFGEALLATKDPIMQARGVATYKRLVARADKVMSAVTKTDHSELIARACHEVALRAHMRHEDIKHKLARMAELATMRDELTFN